MAPAPQPLPDDVIPGILLRLPPDDPAGLVRASAVCKAWRRIIADPDFYGGYRALHPTGAVLGFLHRPSNPELPRFVSTTSFRAAAADHRQHPLDCRHGRAVLYHYGSPLSRGAYVVWDPVTGALHKLLPKIPGGRYLPHAAVVCAAAAAGGGGGGCDHRSCSASGAPFIVAFVGLEVDDEVIYGETTDDEDDDDRPLPSVYLHACFYASDTGELDGEIDVYVGQGRYYVDEDRPTALVGDSLYYLCWPGNLVRYRYGLLRRLDGGAMGMMAAGVRDADVLSMMELPTDGRLGIGRNADVVVMEAEGGGLGLACLCAKTAGTMLRLLAWETAVVGDDDAAAAAAGRWVQRRVIDLKTLLPVGNDPEMIKPCLIGIAQDTNVIFVSTEDGIFSIDHGESSLLQVRKVCETGVVNHWMYPFVSFYTESLLLKLASSKFPAPVGNQ